MKASELKALRAPLKEQYRNQPDSAVITLTASGALDEASIACMVDTGRAILEAGLHPVTVLRPRLTAISSFTPRDIGWFRL